MISLTQAYALGKAQVDFSHQAEVFVSIADVLDIIAERKISVIAVPRCERGSTIAIALPETLQEVRARFPKGLLGLPIFKKNPYGLAGGMRSGIVLPKDADVPLRAIPNREWYEANGEINRIGFSYLLGEIGMELFKNMVAHANDDFTPRSIARKRYLSALRLEEKRSFTGTLLLEAELWERNRFQIDDVQRALEMEGSHLAMRHILRSFLEPKSKLIVRSGEPDVATEAYGIEIPEPQAFYQLARYGMGRFVSVSC